MIDMEFKLNTLKEIDIWVKLKWSNGDVIDYINDSIPSYLPAEWGNDYESEYEAYSDYGNGEAEDEVRTDLMNELMNFLLGIEDFGKKGYNEQQTLLSQYKIKYGEEAWETIGRNFEDLKC